MEKLPSVSIEPGDRVEVIDPASVLLGRTLVVRRATPEGAFLADENSAGSGATAFLHYRALKLVTPNAIHAAAPTLVTAVLTAECMAELVDQTARRVVQLLKEDSKRDYETSWAAGLFEGEGSVWRSKSSAIAALTTTDEDVVKRFVDSVGFGTVYGPYQPKNGKKPFFMWKVTGWNEVQNLYTRFKSYLQCRRRHQFESVLTTRPEYYTKPKRRKKSNPPGPSCGLFDPTIPSWKGYERHRQRKESACVECRKARALYRKQREQ